VDPDEIEVNTYKNGEYLITSKATFADRHFFVEDSDSQLPEDS
jgi:hypothetical protein